MKQIRQLLMLIVFLVVTSFFSGYKGALIQINIKTGTNIVKDLTKTQFELKYKNKPNLKMLLSNTNTLIIKPFLDSAQLHFNFSEIDIETPMLSFSDFKKIDSLDIYILTKVEIELKYRDTSKHYNVTSVYTISSYPKGAEKGFSIETVIATGSSH